MIILRYFHRHLGDSMKVTLGSKGTVREHLASIRMWVGTGVTDAALEWGLRCVAEGGVGQGS